MDRTSVVDRSALVDGLAALVGRANVLCSRRDLMVYAYDAEEVGPGPDAVVFPPDAGAIARVVAFCAERGVPIVVRGAGTNLSGGTVPSRGGVVVEISRLKAVKSIDYPDRRAVVEVGLVNLDLQNLLGKRGYLYGPDPASQKVSTLGGNVGENAGGPHCFKYGVTSNHVLGAEVALADGQIVHLGGPLEDNPGYDLTGLFVGSEGTLGVATDLTLKILRSTESIRTLLAVFDRLEDAGSAVAAIVAAGMIPATLELLDNPMIRAIEAGGSYGYPIDAACILLIEVDGLADELDRQAEDIGALCRQQSASEVRLAGSAAERDALWAGRRGAFGAVARLTPAYVVQDGTVPRTKLPAMLKRVGEIGAKYQVAVSNAAHAGDGNLHPLFWFDPRKPGDAERVQAASAEMLRACVEAGGTLTGEHGIGISKQKSMPVRFGPAELRLFAKIKQAFDPNGLMNPGKVFPPEMPAEVTLAAPSEPNVERLVAALAASESEVASDVAKYAVGPVRPVAAVCPSSEEGVQLTVRAAAEAGVPVVPWGRGAQQAVGSVRPMDALVVDVGGLNRIVDLDAGNQTVDVQPGVTLGELREALRPHRLFFPLEPDAAAEMTVGGLIATAASGPRRLGYGLPRDLVLGLRAVMPDGEIVRAGGKTMKDVAGYDVRKLLIGSWGTLGIVTEATLRLYPVAEAESTLTIRFADAAGAGAALAALLGSPLQPVALDLVNAAGWSAGGVALRIGAEEALLLAKLEGRREAVARLERDVARLVRERGAAETTVLRGADEAAVWEARRMAVTRAVAAGAAQARFSVPISRVADLFTAAPAGVGLVAHAGSGVGRALIPEDGDQANALRFLRAATQSLGGFVLLERGPADLLEAQGELPPRDDYALMRRLRAAIDPNGLFSPGRVL